MENSTADAAPVKKAKLKKIIVLLLAVVLIGGAAGGGFYYWRSAKAAAANKDDSAKSKKNKSKKESDKTVEEESEDEPDEKENSTKKETSKETNILKASLPDDKDVKRIVELQPFIVNLADSDQARYLRMTISLGVGGGESVSEKPDQVFNSRVRNAILAVLSVKKSDDVLSTEGKAKLRKEILQAAQAVSTEPEVEAVYITEFIVQL